MKNHIALNNDGQTANIICDKKDGSTESVLVDIDSLKALSMIPGTWAVSNTNDTGTKYAMTLIDGRRVYMHRHLMLHNDIQGKKIDHKNGIGTDNTMANLQPMSRQQNAAKMKIGSDPYPTSTTGVRNVYVLASGNYSVVFRQKHIGTFPNLESAKYVADSLRAAVNFARLGITNN